MKRIRQKLFILIYLGSLLLITATFVPIVKFNNQSFAFIDQFFYLSFAIVILSTITLILATMKKFKLSLIPTILNIGIIIYGIYNILTIEGLKSTPDFSYGIAFILYPVSIMLNIVGGLLATGKKGKKKEKKKEKDKNKVETPTQDNNTLEIEEPQTIFEEPTINLDPNEQIPIASLLNRNTEFTEISNDDTIDETKSQENNNPEFDENNELLQEDDLTNDTLDNLEQTPNPEENNNKPSTENISILSENDELLEEIEDYEYNDDDFFEEINEEEMVELNNNTITNEETYMSDIEDKENIEHRDDIDIINLDAEIPDIASTEENVMTNNTQVEDAVKPEFMALNPSDIKIDTKKTLFKKKEKKEENPLERIMKRNIPTTLGRTCQFCNTPLGDDERICPICGRIN